MELQQSYGCESELLSRLDEATLERFLGKTIVRAVQNSFDTNVTRELSHLVAVRFGYELLSKQTQRSAIIDVLNEAELKRFEQIRPGCEDIYGYFSNSYNEIKSRELVQVLGFPTGHIKTSKSDDRMERFLIEAKHGQALKSTGYLHGYQKRVKDQVLERLITPGTRLMVQMPTGSGKTFTALETAVDILRRPNQKKFVVWLVNQNELAEQALKSFQTLWLAKGDRPLHIHRLFDRFSPKFSESINGGVVFSTYGILNNVLGDPNDLRRPEIQHLIRNTEYLIVDEAHSAAAETYERCVYAFTGGSQTYVLGLSATPFRNDQESGEQLRRLFSGNLVSVSDEDGSVDDPIRYLQEEKYLARINFEVLDTRLQISGTGDNLLQKLAENPDRNQSIVEQAQRCVSEGRKVIIFSCTKDHAIALYSMCRRSNIPTEYITGEIPQNERLRIFDSFRNEEVSVLTNYDILSTGIDLPEVDTLIITRPVNSPIQYSQIVGRAFRGPKNGGHTENTVLNIKDNLDFYVSLSHLYDSFATAWGG